MESVHEFSDAQGDLNQPSTPVRSIQYLFLDVCSGPQKLISVEAETISLETVMISDKIGRTIQLQR